MPRWCRCCRLDEFDCRLRRPFRLSRVTDLEDWTTAAQAGNAVIVGKRLSANDTGATGAHQVGPYVTRSVVDQIFSEILLLKDVENPKVPVQVSYGSHSAPSHDVALTWYNNRFRGGTRNEFRLT